MQTSMLTCSIPDGPSQKCEKTRASDEISPLPTRPVPDVTNLHSSSGGLPINNDKGFFSLLHRYELRQDRGETAPVDSINTNAE